MPDNKAASWRKKISSKPKDLQLPKTSLDDATNSESGRHRGWRKTLHPSRPATPTPATPATPTLDDIEIQSERRTSSPRRDSKPKLTRYTSLFSGFKDTSKGFEFDTPWDDNQPSYEPYVDPKVAIQCIRSHMVHFSMKPIPLEYSNNLFCIFEHYHKLCEESGHLDADLKCTLQQFEHAEQAWAQQEQKYADEIHRLELLISKGTGVAGVLHARQGSIIDRKRLRRTATTNPKPSTLSESMSRDQIVAEIKSRSQKVLFQRPGSPSGRMTALSRRLGRASTDLHIRDTQGPDQTPPTLSRKVQSELNLAQLNRVNTAHSVANSIGSTFSGDSGDLLPDELPSSQDLSELSIDCDAIIALRELGALVARRRGLNVDTFVEGVMTLLHEEDSESGGVSHTIEPLHTRKTSTITRTFIPPPSSGELTPKQALRKFQSQPQLKSDQRRRRHFSFDPGEDHLQALKADLTTIDVPDSPSHLSPWISSLSRDPTGTHTPSTPNTAPSHDTSTQESQSASKIPSPLQVFGNVRRESSVSSLRSTMARSIDGRRRSRSSILTAYRDDQTNKLRPASSSRSSSCTTSYGARVSPSTKDRTRSIRGFNSGDGQISEHTHHTRTPQGGSPGGETTKSLTDEAYCQARRSVAGRPHDKPGDSG